MRLLFSLFILTGTLLTAAAQEVITASITITNAANITGLLEESLTVNGSVRTWTNGVTAPATQILSSTNSTLAHARLVTHASSYPFTGLQLASIPNGISLRTAPAGALVVTLDGSWGSVSYSTNTITPAKVIRLPHTIELESVRNAMANQLVNYINIATNQLDFARLDTTGWTGVAASPEIAGWVTLTNGSAVVASTNVATNSLVFLTRSALDGSIATVNEAREDRVWGESFTIQSSDTNDIAEVVWKLLNLPTVLTLPYLVGLPPPTPQAYWAFEEGGLTNRVDEIGAVALVPHANSEIISTTGKHGNAMLLPGTTNSGYADNLDTGIAYTTNNHISFNYWFKQNTETTNLIAYFKLLIGGGEIYVERKLAGDPQGLRFGVGSGGGSEFYDSLILTNHVFDTNWHMVTGVYDEVAGTLELYWDGASIGVTSETVILMKTDASIGIDFYGGLQYEESIFDEFYLHMNHKFTTNQIEWLYNEGNGRPYSAF